MDRMTFVQQQWVHLIWVALAIVGILVFLELRSSESLARFLSTTMQQRLARKPTTMRRLVKLGLVLATLVLGTLALMRPQKPGGTEVLTSRQIAADIMVVLDVSKSMLAEDAAPNRLDRAKAEIGEFIDRVQGHRVGLVAFAGRASVKCPLTSDYGFFRLVLRDVDVGSVSRGGTRIGDAVRKTVAAFGPRRNVPRVMLLITDGEDHDSFPLDAVAEATDAGIRVVAIGFGSEQGSEILLTDPETGARSVLTDADGIAVVSRLDGELLREIALRTQGVYVPAGTSALDLDSIIETHVEPMVTDSSATIAKRVPVEYYRWFVIAALATLFGATWLGSTTGVIRREDQEAAGSAT